MLALAAMLAVYFSGGWYWGKQYKSLIEFRIYVNDDNICFLHNSIIDSRVGPAIVRINANLNAGLPAGGNLFSTRADQWDLAVDNEQSSRWWFAVLYCGDLRFCPDHTIPLGFVGPPIGTFRCLYVSWRVLTVALVLLVGWSAMVLIRRWKRPRPGLCKRCSYNLTGNTSGVCPECGTRVPQKSETVA